LKLMLGTGQLFLFVLLIQYLLLAGYISEEKVSTKQVAS